jgi:hypothetical protein
MENRDSPKIVGRVNMLENEADHSSPHNARFIRNRVYTSMFIDALPVP